MKMPIGDIADRYSICKLKSERLGLDNTKELEELKNELEKYASLMGYSSGWVWRQKTQRAGHFTNYTI
jgi:hypothetical protein